MRSEWSERQLQHGVTFDPTFVIYSASRDLMKARTAEWLPTYTLPRLMRFFEANREYHGSYFYDWTSERELAWKKYYELYGRLMNDYKNILYKTNTAKIVTSLLATSPHLQ